MFFAGTSFCYYGVVTDSYEQQSSSNCTARGHVWNSISGTNKCYYARDNANVNITNSCTSGYLYVSNPNDYITNTGLNSGCFPVKPELKLCSAGYTLSGTKCAKIITVDALKK